MKRALLFFILIFSFMIHAQDLFRLDLVKHFKINPSSCEKACQKHCKKVCKKGEDPKESCQASCAPICQNSCEEPPFDLSPYLGMNPHPSDDPFDYSIDESQEYEVYTSQPYWITPSHFLPEGVDPMNSNNNVAIEFHQGRLFVAWRNSPTHFASEKGKMFIISTADGKHWDKEWEIAPGRDLREPMLIDP